MSIATNEHEERGSITGTPTRAPSRYEAPHNSHDHSHHIKRCFKRNYRIYIVEKPIESPLIIAEFFKSVLCRVQWNTGYVKIYIKDELNLYKRVPQSKFALQVYTQRVGVLIRQPWYKRTRQAKQIVYYLGKTKKPHSVLLKVKSVSKEQKSRGYISLS